MLDFKPIQTPFRFGVEEGTDPHQVPFGVLTTLENGEWHRSGQIRKRAGTRKYTRAISGGGTVASGTRLFTNGTELGLVSGSTTYAYQPTNTTWISRGSLPDVALTWETGLDPIEGVMSTDMVLSTTGISRIAHAWVQGDPQSITGTGGGAVFLQILTVTTGSVVVDQELFVAPQRVTFTVTESARRVRVFLSNVNTIIVVWSTSTEIKAREYDFNGSAAAVETVLRNDVNPDMGFDACRVSNAGGAGRFAIAYENAAGDIKFYDYRLDGGGVFTNLANGTLAEPTAGVDRIAICHDSTPDSLYVFYSVGNVRVRYAVRNATSFAAVLAPVTIEDTIVAQHVDIALPATDRPLLMWSTEAELGPPRVSPYTVTGQVIGTTGSFVLSGVADNNKRTSIGVRPSSRLFQIGSRWFFFAMDAPDERAGGGATNPIRTTFDSHLLETELPIHTETNFVPHRYMGVVDRLVAASTLPGSLCSVVSLSATEQLAALPFQATGAASIPRGWRCGLHFVHALTGTSAPADLWRTVELQSETYFGGALLTAYDGLGLFDYGMLAPMLTFNGSVAGGAMAAGTYRYQIVPSFRSRAGVLHRGPASLIQTITVALNNRTILIPTSHAIDGKQSLTTGFALTSYRAVQLDAYRSLVGASTTQRVTLDPRFQTYYNDPRDPAAFYYDPANDSDITGGVFPAPLAERPAPYTAGELDDYPPPSQFHVALHGGRLWAISGDRHTIWVSKDANANRGVAPGFHPTSILLSDARLTATIAMDEKHVVFHETGLFYCIGDGPAPNGKNSDLSALIPIQSEVGCTVTRSIVDGPFGVIFQGAGGTDLYLLTRGLEVQNFSRAVQDQLASFPTITSAVLFAKKNQVRFTCNNAAGTAGIVLVFDYVENQWSTFKYTDNNTVPATPSTPIQHAIIHNGTYHFMTPGGTVYYEDGTTCLDGAGEWTTLKLETAWISAAGPLAYQSVRNFMLSGVSNSNHNLTVTVFVDNETTAAQTARTWQAGEEVTEIGVIERARVSIGKRRKCQNIKFRIEDAIPSDTTTYPVGTGQGPSFDTMGIEVGIKKGFRALGAREKG